MTERDENIIAGIIVSSLLDYASKERLIEAMRADAEASRLSSAVSPTQPIEHFWTALERGWDIEPREYFEREAVPMGFKSPVEMAVHWMWKRHAKDWPNAELKLKGSPHPPTSEERFALDACRMVLHWYESDSSEYNRELAIKACRDALSEDTAWKCKARAATDPPQDCDWPCCGCDPHADKVIAALEESGKLDGSPHPPTSEAQWREQFAAIPQEVLLDAIATAMGAWNTCKICDGSNDDDHDSLPHAYDGRADSEIVAVFLDSIGSPHPPSEERT